jgi:hypothetical protein
MLAYDIKNILTLAPEALDMVKQANLEEDFPTDSRSSTIASVLRIDYMTKVAGKAPDYDAIMRVEKAAALYGVEEEIKPLREKISAKTGFCKQASAFDLSETEAILEMKLGESTDFEKVASEAEDLVKTHGDAVTSELVRTYAGHAILVKEAALGALAARYQATQNPEFIKVASVLRKHDTTCFTPDEVRTVCRTVTRLDKEAGLQVKGFNFYKEALAKESAAPSVIAVNLAGQSLPYEQIQRLGKGRMSSVLGKDVADAMTDDIVANKHMLETLPLDLQRILLSIAKAC